MRIFLAGATGVIGRPLVPLLVAAGHEVTGMTRSPARAATLHAAGAEAAIVDALDAEGVERAITEAQPETVMHQLTSIPARINPRTQTRDFELNDRLRTEGTRILVSAAQRAGASKIVAQSIAFVYEPGPPGTLHGEQDPLVSEPPASFKRSAEAVRSLERTVLDAGGVVLRYGYFYGPGSAISREGSMGTDIRRRRLPIVGSGAGVWSFVHIEDAAQATLAALAADGPAAYNIVDDEPAPAAEWLPTLAQALGARPPRKVPAWLARLAAGSYGVGVMTAGQGASNALAKRELAWTLAHTSWREGFRTALG